jgi:hypothetical protein
MQVSHFSNRQQQQPVTGVCRLTSDNIRLITTPCSSSVYGIHNLASLLALQTRGATRSDMSLRGATDSSTYPYVCIDHVFGPRNLASLFFFCFFCHPIPLSLSHATHDLPCSLLRLLRLLLLHRAARRMELSFFFFFFRIFSHVI